MKKPKMKLYLEIFITFLKISTFTIGGGYAMIPLLKSEIIENKKWINDEDLTDIVTMAQVIPGLVYVSTSSTIGYRVAGIIGAILATISVLIPATVSIILIAYFLKDHLQNELVQNIFIGILAGVTAMTGEVAIDFMKKSVNSVVAMLVFIISFIALEFFGIKAVSIIIVGIVFGFIYSYFHYKKEKINA